MLGNQKNNKIILDEILNFKITLQNYMKTDANFEHVDIY